MAIIKVPKTPKKAYQPTRKASDLLVKQIEHLEWAALPAAQRKPSQLRKPKVKTEAQAARRVAQLTAIVFDAKRRQEAGERPAERVILPPMPPAGAPARPSRPKPKPRAKRRGKGRRS
jgi:hypothetical protein